jgi:hypothetical protein
MSEKCQNRKCLASQVWPNSASRRATNFPNSQSPSAFPNEPWEAEERCLSSLIAGSNCALCGPTNSIEYDAVTNPYCSRRSDHGVDPCARELAEIADLQPVVANECPKNIRILG